MTPRDVDTNLTFEQLRCVLDYDALTGVMSWTGLNLDGKPVEGKGSYRRSEGRPAGTRMASGYVRIEIGGFGYLRHRLAWFWMTGRWPEDQIDHQNLQKGDDRWDNLRPAGADQNQANRGLRPHNKSGFTGVGLIKPTGRWYAELSIGNRLVFRQSFDTRDEAVLARKRAVQEHHDQFAYEGG